MLCDHLTYLYTERNPRNDKKHKNASRPSDEVIDLTLDDDDFGGPSNCRRNDMTSIDRESTPGTGNNDDDLGNLFVGTFLIQS